MDTLLGLSFSQVFIKENKWGGCNVALYESSTYYCKSRIVTLLLYCNGQARLRPI